MYYQENFKRYEIKCLITSKQKEDLLNMISSYVRLDEYGKTAHVTAPLPLTIQNYFYHT